MLKQCRSEVKAVAADADGAVRPINVIVTPQVAWLQLDNFCFFLLLSSALAHHASTEPCRVQTDGAPTTPVVTMGPDTALRTIPAAAGATPPNMTVPAVGQPLVKIDGDNAAALANDRSLLESAPAGGPPLAKYETAL